MKSCRNGHTYHPDDARVRSDGYPHCPVCYKEGESRRNRRYYERIRESDAYQERVRANGKARTERKQMNRIGW